MRFIGNKTQLLDNIKEVVDRHVSNASSFCDIFSGTASVARFFTQWYRVYSNDLLYFSYCLQRATVEMPFKPRFRGLLEAIGISNPIKFFNSMPTGEMAALPKEKRFFVNNYAPSGGRMYMTDSNALRIDYSRNTVEEWRSKGYLSEDEYYYLVACIVEGVPFISNIAGTYGAYSKVWDARTKKLFELVDLPVCENGKENQSWNEDGADLLKRISGDILYIDPPYNARQYLPNYHVLETAAKYDFPLLKGTSGMRPYDSQKSLFCSKRHALGAFDGLIENADFEHIILSYNTDGIMALEDIESAMKKHCSSSSFEVNYIPYRRYKSKSDVVKTGDLKEMIIYIRK